MTIAKDFAAKASVAFVAAAMLFSMIAPAAQAQSAEDLQKMINDLMGQIASLQGGSTTGGDMMSAAGVCPYTWTRDLSSGSNGADVMKLQQFLNADADTRVAASGVGSAGMESQTFGPATAAAVSKFQVKYRADVLSPAGLVNPTGYFGPGTRAKANALCVATTGGSTTGGSTTGGSTDEEEEESSELSGEASLNSFEMDTEESSVEEGEADVAVGMITVEFEDGDASISRLDLTLVGDTSDQPWDAFDTVSLWVDGDMVAEMDASDEDEYLDEDAGELRFSGLDIVAMEDEEVEITVAVTVQDNLDSTEITDWTVTPTSMRFFDADGVASTETSNLDGEAEFEIEVAGANEEIKVSLASSNPDATDVVVDTDSDTDDVTIMVADIEAEDNDIELQTVVVKVDTTGASTTAVVDDIRVVIDGEEFDAETLVSTNKGTISSSESRYVDNNSTDDSVWYVFDVDGDVVIDEDSEVSMEVVVDFNDTDDGVRYGNGVTIEAAVTSVELAAWDAEGAENLTHSSPNQFKGTAVGDEHTLVAEGILVPVDGFSSEVDTLGQNDTIGEFTLEFEVTAVEGDFYITETTGTTTITNGVEYAVDGFVAGDVVSASLTSTADEDTNDVYTVREGETETFTLTVTVDPSSTGTYSAELAGIFYSENTNGSTGAVEYVITTPSDFDTAPQSIQGS